MPLVGDQYRLAVFLSGKGSNFEALLKATRQGEVPGRIVLVVSNNPDARGVQVAREEGIAVEILRRDDFPDGATFAWRMLSQLRRWQVEVICLAGYMKKIPSVVVRAYRNRILNIHPALLPKFGGKGMYGLKVHQAVLDAGEKESGVTIHLVDEIYDHGPILAQEKVAVMPDDTPEILQHRIQELEHNLYPRVLKDFLMRLTQGDVSNMIAINNWGWQDKIKITQALISAYRKEPAVELARVLHQLGVKIWATWGTAEVLRANGIPAESIDQITGFSELIGGRVKSLHPQIFASVLARDDDRITALGLIDLVAVDLYPFEESWIQGKDLQELVELIDIGGVALIRAGAKNFRRVAVLAQGKHFEDFAKILITQEGYTTLALRRRLAEDAFWWTSYYDSLIAHWLWEERNGEVLPPLWTIPLKERRDLRYGENPHQPGYIYLPPLKIPEGIGRVNQLGGKELSYNNFLDIEIALRLPNEFSQPAVAIIKHTTPCGVGRGDSPLEAFRNALSTDPISAFGGIIGFNCSVDEETAREVRKGFVEVVCAPNFSNEALQELKRSKNLRIIEYKGPSVSGFWEVKGLWGGVLIQRADVGFPELSRWEVFSQEGEREKSGEEVSSEELSENPVESWDAVTQRKPDAEEWEALKFAWVCCRYVKSNAIVIAERNRTLGIGAGQMSRLDAAHLAVWKAQQAGLSVKGAVAASDAFFPFPDGVEELAKAGVKAIIQPGGSVRDKEVIAAADSWGLAMVFTGRRHFRH